MLYTRRQMIKNSTAAVVGFSLARYLHADDNTFELNREQDEQFWQTISQQFEIDNKIINLENGYYGIMPKCVFDAYLENTRRLNRHNSYFLRTTWKAELEANREYLAHVLGVAKNEIVFTRNGTDAMQKLISGYNKLNPGDHVLYADLDFHSCQDACEWLQDRRKVVVSCLNIPEPATKQNVIELYKEAFEKYPRVKLVFLTHMSNKTGLVLPVKEIAELAKSKNIDVIVDAAHSWGQLDFNIPDLNADFVGLTLHKWIHAPLGLGCMYIKNNRLHDIDPCFGSKLYPHDDIRSRVLNGTDNMAAGLTLNTALDFHMKIGVKNKQDRLKFLRNLWVTEARKYKQIEILTPDDPEMYGAITSFRITNRTSSVETDAIVNEFLNKYKIFVVRRTDIHLGDCIRVTPAIYTKRSEVEIFTKALIQIATA